MNSLYIIVGVILLIALFYPKITISENQIYSPVNSTSNKLSTPRIYDFYIPQLTNPQVPLSQNIHNNQTNANILTRNTFLNSDEVDIIRKELKDNNEHKYPKYILKDTLSANTIGSTELYNSGDKDYTKEYKPFTDENISQYPGFYTSELKNEITNIGQFFDKKNRYSDTTYSNSSAYINDDCYTDSKNNIICIDNTRLQNIPPKNTDMNGSCEIEKTIGNYKIKESKDSVMNGLSFYDSVYASSKKNETFSPFIKSSVSECSI